MAHFVGLDVSVKETSVCVVDDAGKVILEQKVASRRVAISIRRPDQVLDRRPTGDSLLCGTGGAAFSPRRPRARPHQITVARR